jgi:hypothetical protein
MPYLAPGIKASLDQGRKINNGGELNYTITKLLIKFVLNRGLSYSTINEAMGALESCKLEFYRRVAAPYENGKALSNGDVFDIGGL